MSKPQELPLQEIEAYLKITAEDKKQEACLKTTGNGVFFLVLNRKVNSFTIDFIRLIHELLDQVEAHEGPTSLVTLGLNHKFFSTGLDLNFVTQLQKHGIHSFILEFIRLLGRFLAFPVPCIAMLNGHAFAGGCMFAFAHDYRIMRNDFGQLCLNEVSLGLHLPPGMNAVVQDKISDKQAFRDMILTAKRFGPQEAFQKGMVDKLASPQDLFKEVLVFAEEIAKFGIDKENFKKLKDEANINAINCCFNKGYAVGVKGEVKFSFPVPSI